MFLSPEDEQVLLDGLDSTVDTRLATWSAHRPTVERLAFLGLMDIQRVPHANGVVMTIPLGLSKRGARVAREIQRKREEAQQAVS
ncbi:MAG TPA: hypothetical protein VEJ87_08140 [Acidimicrobiales bacterium]|nr:hypothetical protein [Acidimicrobiales bacterium]